MESEEKKEKPVSFFKPRDVLGQEKPSPEKLQQEAQDHENKFSHYEFPSLITRFQALIIDTVIIILIFSLANLLINLVGGAPSWVRESMFIFTIFLYEPLLVHFNGGSLGHQIMNLQVRSIYNPKKRIWLLYAMMRFGFKVLFGWLSFITFTSDKKKRCLHDLASGAVVIIKPKTD